MRISAIPQAWRAVACMTLLSSVAMNSARSQTASPNVAQRAAAEFVRPGDRIYLHFLREKQMSDTVTVNERGEAVFPKLGSLAVAGIRIGQIQDTLVSRFSAYLRNPELEAVVLRRVIVNGEVKNPDVYYVDVSSGVREAIALAGGITQYGSRNNVSLVRGTEQVSLRNWETDAGVAGDLRSGDQIIVGRRSWVSQNAAALMSTGVVLLGLVFSLTRR